MPCSGPLLFATPWGTIPVLITRECELIIYWGRQPIYSGPVARPAKSFLAAKQRGVKIVAIKPSVEPDVGMADIWVPLRPGTDAALALAMLNVVIRGRSAGS